MPLRQSELPAHDAGTEVALATLRPVCTDLVADFELRITDPPGRMRRAGGTVASRLEPGGGQTWPPDGIRAEGAPEHREA